MLELFCLCHDWMFVHEFLAIVETVEVVVEIVVISSTTTISKSYAHLRGWIIGIPIINYNINILNVIGCLGIGMILNELHPKIKMYIWYIYINLIVRSFNIDICIFDLLRLILFSPYFNLKVEGYIIIHSLKQFVATLFISIFTKQIRYKAHAK